MHLRRSLVGTCVWLAYAFAAASPGTAGAAALAFTGTLTVELAVERISPEFVMNGSGTAIVNGSGGGGHLTSLQLPSSPFAASGSVLPVTDIVGGFPLAGIQLTAHAGAGSIMGGGGVIPLVGVAKMCLFGACQTAPNNLSIPLSLVGGGTHTAQGGVNLTIIGAPWTTGTVSIGSITRMGFARGPASAPSSTAQASGRLQLVTPVMVSTNVALNPVFANFLTLTLHFVPEPATAMLLGAGVAALAAIGRRRSG